MKNMNISKNIADLRKEKGLTQEQLAAALNLSPQAVSKWETGISQPDTQTLPLIADYFNVSIDYLFYGKNVTGDEIYEKVFTKVAEHSQMSRESYEDAFTIFGYAHHGISRGNLTDHNRTIFDVPAHISDENGLSLLSGKGYGAILTRSFFESINQDTVEFAETILPVLSEKANLIICMAIIMRSDISVEELKEKTKLDEDNFRQALAKLVKSGIVVEKKSKHKSVGYTYEINSRYHTCLCIILATIEMQRYSLNGIFCCMGYGDYPMNM